MNRAKVFDELLIMRCQEGNNRAFELIMKRWNKKLISFAHKYTHDIDTACDIAQDSWVAVFKNINKLKEPNKFGPWIYRLCYHKCIDHLRKVKHKNEVDIDHEQVEMQSESSDNDDKWTTIASILQRLPATQKTILTLFYLEEQSIKQIAEILNLAEGTVKSRIFYARESLKQKYKEVNNETF